MVPQAAVPAGGAPGFDASLPKVIATTLTQSRWTFPAFSRSRKSGCRAIFSMSMSKDTEQQYELLMEHHVKSLDSLAALGVPLPPFVAAPIAYVLTRQWNTAINEIEIYGRENAALDRLVSLWAMAKKYGITLDLHQKFPAHSRPADCGNEPFQRDAQHVSSERMRFLLTIVDRFSIPFAKNKCEDLFHSILKTAIRPMYDAFKTSPDTAARDHIVSAAAVCAAHEFQHRGFPGFMTRIFRNSSGFSRFLLWKIGAEERY